MRIKIDILNKEQYESYSKEIINIFEENFFKNGGFLYSDNFMITSDFIVIARIDNTIVGYMAVSANIEEELDEKYDTYIEKIEHNCLVIKHFVVSKKYRNIGVGTKLMDYIIRYAKCNSIKCLYLWTTPDNLVALNFYNSRGFYTISDYRPAKYIFQGLEKFHSIMMVKKLVSNE